VKEAGNPEDACYGQAHLHYQSWMDEAMNWLEKGYAERFNPGVLIRPGFDPLRSDPRFQKLAHRVGLPG
jgi:hypothetical protein